MGRSRLSAVIRAQPPAPAGCGGAPGTKRHAQHLRHQTDAVEATALTQHSPHQRKRLKADNRVQPAAVCAVEHQEQPALQGDGQTGAAVDPSVAYKQLMGILQRGKGDASRLLRTRLREEEGVSEGEADDESSEDPDAHNAGVAESAEEGVAAVDSLPGSGDEAQVDEATRGEQEAGSSDELDSDSSPAAANGSRKPAATGNGNVRHRTHRRASATAPAGLLQAPAVNGPDTWQQHVEHQLTDAQAAQLVSVGRAKWEDIEAPASLQGGLLQGAHWQACGGAQLPATFPATLDGYNVKERLVTRWREVRREEQDAAAAAPAGGQAPAGRGPELGSDFWSDDQRAVFAALHSYADLVVGTRPYPESSTEPDRVQDAYLLHALNHVAKTADRIKKNNERLESARAAAAPDEPLDTPRDQGFTRPKVLVLLPQRNLAFRLVLRLVRLAIRETRADSVTGKARFVEQFTDPEEVDEQEMDAAAAARRAAKPRDWLTLLGSGNLDDHFRLGIKITRGAIRLFADLLQSDIIVASPLALATKLEEDARRREERAAANANTRAGRAAAARQKADGSSGDGATDFLSSIELLIIDRADMMLMQNWGHVERVLEALNQLPSQQHGVDIMRVREWALSGWTKHYRQTVLLSSFLTPAINALVGGQLTSNYHGRLRLVASPPGVLQLVVPQVQQVFERFSGGPPEEAAEARFHHFTQKVWPRLREASGWASGGLVLFIPTYYDFVRLRNFFKAEDDDMFESLTEYSQPARSTAARNRFFQNRVQLLLYTERAHFYKRFRIRGIRDIMFYGPPDHAQFYAEVVNLLETGARGASMQSTVGLLFCKWDALALERIVGTTRATKMIKGEASTYLFC